MKTNVSVSIKIDVAKCLATVLRFIMSYLML